MNEPRTLKTCGEIHEDGLDLHFYGACPVQGMGTLDGRVCYYRARGSGWRLSVWAEDGHAHDFARSAAPGQARPEADCTRRPMTFPSVTVTSYDVAQELLTREPAAFDCVLSINDIDQGSAPPYGFDEFCGMKLALFFDDVIDTRFDLTPPSLDDAKKIVAFARAAEGKILVHCAAGISRSTAAAISIPAVRMATRSVNADAIMRWLREVRPVARPNPLLVQMIDGLTGWNGRLSKACASHFSL